MHFLLLFTVACCKKRDELHPFILSKQQLFFDLNTDGQKYTLTYLGGVNMFYYYDKRRVYFNDTTGNVNPSLLVTCLPVGMDADGVPVYDTSKPLLLSGTSFLMCIMYKVHDFYLEYPDHSLDTIYMDYNAFLQEGLRDSSYLLKTLTFNGKVATIDSSYLKYNPNPVFQFWR